MNLLQDRRVLLAGGAGAALLAGALIAAVASGRKPPEATVANGALKVVLGEQARVDPSRTLRCFVGGQLIGMETLADCARRNGVAAQSLDVGLDESGALAAGGKSLVPLPVAPPVEVTVAAEAAPPAPVEVARECLRYGPDGWRSAGGAANLSACVQALFAGHCQRPGEALYGRWGGQSLRLVPGRVESSNDNRTFQALVEQNRDCSIPSVG